MNELGNVDHVAIICRAEANRYVDNKYSSDTFRIDKFIGPAVAWCISAVSCNHQQVVREQLFHVAKFAHICRRGLIRTYQHAPLWQQFDRRRDVGRPGPAGINNDGNANTPRARLLGGKPVEDRNAEIRITEEMGRWDFGKPKTIRQVAGDERKRAACRYCDVSAARAKQSFQFL